MDEFFIVAVDIGGTSFRVALADHSGHILRKDAEPTHPLEGPQKGLQRIRETIGRVISGIDPGKLKSIVVASAGPVDPEKGIILTPPSLPGWDNIPLRTPLEEAFKVPVCVESDADLAALGEHRFGAGRGFDRLIYITVSTGIGGGIIIDGEVLRGTQVSVAEIGHMIVDPQGPICNCGGKGHLEALASGTAIERLASEIVSRGISGALSDICGNDPLALTAEMVAEAARRGDSLACEIFEEAGIYLGMAISSLMHLFDPQVVIIGGGVSNAGYLLLEPVKKAIAEYAMTDFKNRTQVVCSELGDDSGIIGAIAFALDELRTE